MPAKNITPSIDPMGYLRITLPDGRRVREHVHVMEQYIGRRIERHEVVHHRDGNRANNTLDNLELMARSAHMRLHMTGRSRTGGRWAIGFDACVVCGQTDTDHRGMGVCKRCGNRRDRDAARGKPPRQPGDPRKSIIPPGQWTSKHVACRSCGTTTGRHAGRGLCVACYHRAYRHAGAPVG